MIKRKTHRRHPLVGALVVGLLAALGALPAAAHDDGHRVPLDDGLRVLTTANGERYLEVLPATGEGLLALSRRTTGGEAGARAIAAANGGADILVAGRWYRVPLGLLTPELRARALAAVHGGGCLGPEGWVHRVGAMTADGNGGNGGAGGAGAESLWQIAEWYTGSGENFAAIRDFNLMEDEVLQPRDRLIVPTSLLVAPFRRAPRPCDEPAARSDLTYESGGAAGPAAVYRLQPGEALYSSVVVRFTGLTTAADVNALAAEIAALNGIADVTDIPAGRRIRIPFEHLLPEYLPATDPRRLAWERERAATEGYQNTVLALDLAGITIVLDAGHGGRDPGNTVGEVWESVYVYDIMLRAKELLETTTAATVVPTTRDGEAFRLLERDVLPISRRHTVLTSPPYPIEDSSTGVHLRWYLANSVLDRAVGGGADAREVVFVSLHADSLHPSLRGAMVYVANAGLSHGRYGKNGTVFASRREVRQRQFVEFTLAERRQSEGLSRELADELLTAFRRSGLAVATEKPVRDKIFRHRRPPFVPAVLRYNAVPVKVLLEICNLANPKDRELIQTREFRQRVAEALVDALVSYYGTAAGGTPPVQTAAAAR